jgi:transcriptional regulator
MVYTPSHFAEPRSEVLADFIRDHNFGILVTAGAAGMVASHIPFLYDAEDGPHGTLWAHLARGNPQLKDLGPGREALAIFEGPHGYITPRWYATHPAVPTWNYSIVHAYGAAEPIEDVAELERLVARLADHHETGAETPWRLADQPEKYRQGMLKGISGFAIRVTRLEGKFKLSQNRDATDRARVIAALRAEGNTDLADLMAKREVEGGVAPSSCGRGVL